MNVFNGEAYLRSSLNSIFNQTYDNFEIIFIDNNSQDKTEEIALSYNDKRLRYIKTPRHMKLGEARNFATSFFRGKYLGFLDYDDIWWKDKLKKQVQFMLKSDLVLSFGSSRIIDQKSNVIKAEKLGNKKIRFEDLLIKNYINQQSVLINLNKVNIEFNETKQYAPDFHLFINIIAKFPEKFDFINDFLVDYRIHGQNLTIQKKQIRYLEGFETLKELQANFPDLYKKYFIFFLLGRTKKRIQHFLVNL